MRRILFLVFLSLLFVLGACGGSSDTGGSEDGVTKIKFWHGVEGDNGDTLNELVSKFNEQSDSVEVESSFQGDVKDQMRTVGSSDSAPDVFLDGSVAYYSQTDYISTMEDMMDEDSDFDESTLDDAVIKNSRVNKVLHGMPFNVFESLLVYNVDLFEKAGLDPENPPETFDEIAEMAADLSGEKVDGFSIPLDSSFIYNLYAIQDELVYNNENGREGEAPTETYINNEVGNEIYNWINDMFQNGDFGNFGRTWSDTQLAFSSGELAMYLDSSAVTRIWLNDLDFEFKTAPFPVPEEGEEWAGLNQGGSYLYLSSQSSEGEREAGWEFVKYLISAESQSEWAANTGYVPVAPEAAEMAPLKEAYEENEQLKVAYDSLKNTQPSNATAGPLVEQTKVKEVIVDSLESLLQGNDPDSVLNEAEEKINNILQEEK